MGLRSVHRRNGDADARFALCFPFVDAARGRHIGVVAADRDVNVAFAAEKVVRGIKRNPSGFAEKRFNPSVRRAGRRTVLVFCLAIKIAANGAARDFQLADQRDHDVGEILADAATGAERVVDRRVYFGGIRRVIKFVVERFVELGQQFKR